MPRVKFEDLVYDFPDDVKDDEIVGFLAKRQNVEAVGKNSKKLAKALAEQFKGLENTKLAASPRQWLGEGPSKTYLQEPASGETIPNERLDETVKKDTVRGVYSTETDEAVVKLNKDSPKRFGQTLGHESYHAKVNDRKKAFVAYLKEMDEEAHKQGRAEPFSLEMYRKGFELGFPSTSDPDATMEYDTEEIVATLVALDALLPPGERIEESALGKQILDTPEKRKFYYSVMTPDIPLVTAREATVKELIGDLYDNLKQKALDTLGERNEGRREE